MVDNMFQCDAGVMSSAQAQAMVPSMGLVWSTMSTPSVAPVSSGGFPGLPLIAVVPAGTGYMGQGLLPIQKRLTKKILQLELSTCMSLCQKSAEGLRGEHKGHTVASASEDCTCYRYPTMAPVLYWHGRRLIAEIPPHGAETDGLSGYDHQV